MPPMQEWQQLNNIVSYHRQSRRFHENSSGGKVQLLKRKRSEPNRQEQDMELEDQGQLNMKPVSQSCAVAKSKQFWQATRQSNLTYEGVATTKS